MPSAVRLPGAHEQVHLAALHLLLEDAEANALTRVEHLIDPVQGIAHVVRRAGIHVGQRAKLRAGLGVVERRGGLEPSKVLDDAGAISQPGQTIVCVPKKILIRLEGKDGSAAYSAVSY